MHFHSSHSVKAYLSELRDSLDNNPLHYGLQGFRGIVLGRFFYIKHKSGYDLNRKLTSEENTAVGYVKSADNTTSIHFYTTKGVLDPLFIIRWVVTSALVIRFFPPMLAQLWIVVFLGFTILNAVINSVTKDGKDGKRRLVSLLRNPKNPEENF